MTLRILDTRTKRKVPVDGPVSLFVCGESGHDVPTLETARTAVVFDTLVRSLRGEGLPVTTASAFMDTDERVAARARIEGRPPAEVARGTAPAHRAARAALGCRPFDRFVVAGEAIAASRRLRDRLLAADLAYRTSAGVAFRASRVPGYGELSGQRREKLLAGETEPGGLEHPLDVMIWNGSDDGGAPNWHLECPALSLDLLGPRLTVHGGSADLVFPHDENTRAIVESLEGGPYAAAWMHVGPVVLAARDAAAGRLRLFRLPDLFECHAPLDVRFYLLSHHHRMPLTFEPEKIAGAAQSRQKLARFLAELDAGGEEDPPGEVAAACGGAWEALADDLNAPRAIGLIHVLRKRARAHPAWPAVPFGRSLRGCIRSMLVDILGVVADET